MAEKAKSLQETLIDNMYSLQEQYTNLLEERAANRNSLRDLAKQEGVFTDDQLDAIFEVYPERQARTPLADLSPQEKAERAQRRAEVAAEKAAAALAELNG